MLKPPSSAACPAPRTELGADYPDMFYVHTYFAVQFKHSGLFLFDSVENLLYHDSK